MEAAIRVSRNSPSGTGAHRFLHVDVAGKTLKLGQVREVRQRIIEYDTLYVSSKVPTFRTFDWHPVTESLIAVGQSGGEATLLNIADSVTESISFSVRMQRPCNAVALNTGNLIAVGLDKVRTDFCLNIWDFSQRLPSPGSKGTSKAHTEPLHKLAGGEPITSLKYFNEEPSLLAAGVKGQYMRLYDLREPNSSNSLQFQTRCVHNIAIDFQDDNYFSSCYPNGSDPLVCVWDRRMISRTTASPVSFGAGQQAESRQPEASLEIKNPVDSPGSIWSLRFAKSRTKCLGILSNTGQLRACDIGSDVLYSGTNSPTVQRAKRPWYESEPDDLFLDNARDIERLFPVDLPLKDQKTRVVSFDFVNSSTRYGEPKVMVLTGEGNLRIAALHPPPEPAKLSSSGFMCKGSIYIPPPTLDTIHGGIGKGIDRIRRSAEPRNSLKQAFKNTKHNKLSNTYAHNDMRRMSSFADQCWNTDLGFSEKGVTLDDLLKLISVPRLRCESGYLLNAPKNKTVISDSRWLESYWSWIELAERISKHGGMTQDNVDLAYSGVYGLWMEEIAVKHRLVAGNPVPLSGVIKNLARRLNVPVKRLCPTEYAAHRQLCLHVAGLAWGPEELESNVKKLIGSNQYTKAAATALFASDDKLACKALRSKGSNQTHKMLAMALVGSKQRRKPSASSSATEDSSTDGDDDWSDTISSLSSELADPYARAILAFVKSGDWSDVLEIDALPLKQRVGIALRHLEDNELTAYIGRITRQVIESGDVEGIVLTGLGTTEGVGLLSSYTRAFNDVQTAILGLSFAGAAQRFVVYSNDRDTKAKRTIEAFRETYRAQIMQWGLKFDRVRFDIASSRALDLSPQHKLPRPKAQVRLVCTYCSGSLTQFPSNGPSSNLSTPAISPGPNTMRAMDTPRHPLTAEKAAVTGTICPKCGRHLPRCGVCDMWLGAPDETHAKWYTSLHSHQNHQGQQANSKTKSAAAATAISTNGKSGKPPTTDVDLTASMTGSVMTAIAGSAMTSSTVTIRPGIDTGRKDSEYQGYNKLATSTVVDEDYGQQQEEAEEEVDEAAIQRIQEEKKWMDAMQRLTVFCFACGHGFHAAHARLWFEGKNGRDGHRICPVPSCECLCNG